MVPDARQRELERGCWHAKFPMRALEPFFSLKMPFAALNMPWTLLNELFVSVRRAHVVLDQQKDCMLLFLGHKFARSKLNF